MSTESMKSTESTDIKCDYETFKMKLFQSMTYIGASLKDKNSIISILWLEDEKTKLSILKKNEEAILLYEMFRPTMFAELKKDYIEKYGIKKYTIDKKNVNKKIMNIIMKKYIMLLKWYTD